MRDNDPKPKAPPHAQGANRRDFLRGWALDDKRLQPEVANIMQRDGYMPDTRTAAQTAAFFRHKVEETAATVKAAGIEPN